MRASARPRLPPSSRSAVISARCARCWNSLDLLDRAIYVEQVTTAEQRVMPLVDVTEVTAPYFSLVLIPRGPDQ